MTERPAEIAARIENVRQLDSVVTAIRGIAASRAQQSRNLLAGIGAYANTVSMAIGEALHFFPEQPARPTDAARDGHALILFCAEQGFAGGLSDRVIEAAGSIAPGTRVIVVGSRGSAIATERGLRVDQTIPMANQINGVSLIANRIADAVYDLVATGAVTRADILCPKFDGSRDLTIERSALVPIELEKFRRPAAAFTPLATLKPQTLIERLTAEYVYARLCEAAMHAFIAENEARMQTMSAASSNIDRNLSELLRRQNQIRQEAVTAEIVELAANRVRPP